jgi:HK97 family phage major capsid protein
MDVKIKFLEDYKTFKAGDTGMVSKEGADDLVARGAAEIVLSDVEVKDAAETTKKEIEATVKEAIKTELKALPKVEVKDKPIYDSFGQFIIDVRDFAGSKALTDEMNQYKNFLHEKAPAGNNTLINSEGGFLVPEEFSTALMGEVAINEVIMPRTRTIPINSRIKMPYINTTDMSGSAVGGVDVAWGNEGGLLSSSKAEFKMVELALKKLHAVVYATDELLSDSAVAVESVMSQLAGSAIARERDEVIVNGIGGSRPLGIMKSPALITVAKTSGQTADTITTDNVTNMWSRISNAGNAVWLINRSALPQIYKLNLAVGTAGGSNVFMFNVAERQSETIFGAPIIWTDHAAALGDKGDIVLCDLSQYLTATKAGGTSIKTASSIHVRFLTDETTFKFTTRMDGQSWWPTVKTPKRGVTTSPFVTLAARA